MESAGGTLSAPPPDTVADEGVEIVLRSYQREMLQAALSGNAIVVMPTGSGKTLVAVARIRHELEQSAAGDDRLIWFLANSVELCLQHYEILQQQLPAYRIIPLLGSDNTDKWSEQRLWSATLKGVHIVVGTPDVLKDALTHGFVRINQIRLLIFDEAHHAIKKHGMNIIMTNFYHVEKAAGSVVPKILGLTASPTMNAREGSLEQLESNLDAQATTPQQWLEELNKHVYPPEVTVVNYQVDAVDYPGPSVICQRLQSLVINYDFNSDPYVVEISSHATAGQDHRLQKVLEKRKTACSDQIKTLNRQLETLAEKLGYPAAENYFRLQLAAFQAKNTRNVLATDLLSREAQHVANLLDSVISNISQPRTDAGLASPARRVEELVDLLNKEASPSLRGIIFVRERVIATELSRMLKEADVLSRHYSVGAFVGTSTSEKRKAPVPDLTDPKQQRRNLADFRDGTKNLIIATSVLQEGIDVSACNLVINFDLPDTLVGFIQRRGRARQKDSRYYVFIASNDIKNKPLQWQMDEDRMRRQYMDADRERAEAEADDADALASKTYRVPGTQALLTMDNAKAHLYHFCAVSTLTSSYIDKRPAFFTEQAGPENWSASVVLPSFVHPDVRSARTVWSWRSEGAAIKDVAFEAYIALHKAGLVNDNLLPLLRDTPDEISEELRQTSIVTVANQKSSRISSPRADAAQQVPWYSSTLAMALPDGRPMTMSMLVPAPVEQDEPFILYWNEQVALPVKVTATDAVKLVGSRLERARRNTHVLMMSMYNSRISERAGLDFPIYIDIATDLVGGSIGCRDGLASGQDWGLIHVEHYHNKAFLLRRIEEIEGHQMAVVVPFPKRRDFLHPVPPRDTNLAYSTERQFSLDECTMDALPQDFALLAAFVPSLMHRLHMTLLAQDLGSVLLPDTTSTSLVREAISAPSAGEGYDYNRLEYLGDAILKLCAHLQVMAQFPTWPEGYLTRKKTHLVCNSTLTKAALHHGLEKYILSKPFTGAKWRPPYSSSTTAANVESTREMSTKVLADVVEALIGAAFVDGGLDKGYTCLRSLLHSETWFPSAELFNRLTPPRIATPAALETLQTLVGHTFKSPALLVEAITHASIPFHAASTETGMSYERLEFLGDAVLDLVIVPKLYAHSLPLRHNEMHSYHEAVVNGMFLGYCCMSYHVEQEHAGVVRSGERFDVAATHRDVHLHDFIRAGGELLTARQKALDSFETHRYSVEWALEQGVEYPWADLAAMDPPKFFSDIVESILGAIYIDTRGNVAACEDFLEKLGVLHYLRLMLERKTIVLNPKERLGIAAVEKSVEYVKTAMDKEGWNCTVKIGGIEVGTAGPCVTYKEAELRAALDAIEALDRRTDTPLDQLKAAAAKEDVEMGGMSGTEDDEE
ncbi:hypothetical protein BDZ85DRAFT_267874 [Elsinoe ampelina]|uniref:P-loop containing nucleoside triphosphate hydrolase protein n=1 Tax=Elsinoe ampelina TaxID=302913 RepID=A0A6A6G2I7_9PEZI|nr:hypothetical protein BDZ85DRAFT_267874 [Elsinoe ampelina]